MQDVPLECALCRDEVEAMRHGPTGIVVVNKEPDPLGTFVQLAGVLLRMVPDGEPTQSTSTIHESRAVAMLLRRFAAHKTTCKALPRSKPPEMTKTVPTRPVRKPLP